MCGMVVTPFELSMGSCLKKRMSWLLTAATLIETPTLPITAFSCVPSSSVEKKHILLERIHLAVVR